MGKSINCNWDLPHHNEMSNNSKIQNKMPLCHMAKQGILWHRSNVIVLFALSHRINLSHRFYVYQKQHTHVTGSLSDYNVVYNLGSLRKCRIRNGIYLTTIRTLFETPSKGFNRLLKYLILCLLFYFLLTFAFIWLLHLRNGICLRSV